MQDSSGKAAAEDGSGSGAHMPSVNASGNGSRRRADPPASLVIFEKRPPRFDQLFTYGSHAALAACLFGFAWAAGSYFSGNHSPFDILKPRPGQTIASQDSAGRAETLQTAMIEDIRALKASVEALRAAQSQPAQDAAGLEGLKMRLEAMKTETGASIAALAGKVERMQREPEAKLSQIIERLDRMERQSAASLTTGSVHAAAAPAAAMAGKQLRVAEAKVPQDAPNERRNPQLISNWVVRDVYDGVALVESPRGSIEVSPGENIPGAGTVKSIERRGAGWIVITSRGLVDSARAEFLP
jgi:hypothetical protein